MISNTMYIPASRERVFSALTAYPSYPEWVPNCEHCTVLSSSGSSTIVEMVMNATRRIRIRVRFDGVTGQALQFELVSGKELKRYSGTYRLVTAEDGSGTVLFSDVDLEVASVPRFLTDGPAKKALDKGAVSLKKFVEKFAWAEGSAPPLPPRPRTPLRARRLLQIVKLKQNYRFWFMGQSITVKSIGGDAFHD